MQFYELVISYRWDGKWRVRPKDPPFQAVCCVELEVTDRQRDFLLDEQIDRLPIDTQKERLPISHSTFLWEKSRFFIGKTVCVEGIKTSIKQNYKMSA